MPLRYSRSVESLHPYFTAVKFAFNQVFGKEELWFLGKCIALEIELNSLATVR